MRFGVGMAGPGMTRDPRSYVLGVEIGRNKVRLVLLDQSGRGVVDVIERPIAKAGGPRDPIEQVAATQAALQAALSRLGVEGHRILTGATIGFSNCGVGSGPALLGWLETLSGEIGEPVIVSGRQGVSYAPSRCIEFVQRVFEGTELRLDRVELAPVAANRVAGSLPVEALTLGSGVAWMARVLNDEVLEAFESAEGPFDDVLRVVAQGANSPAPLVSLAELDIAEDLCRNRGVSIAALAPAAGVARSLFGDDDTNLLDGESIVDSAQADDHDGYFDDGVDPEVWSQPAVEVERPAAPAPQRPQVAPPTAGGDDTYQLRRVPAEARASSDYELAEYHEPELSDGREFDDLAGIEAFAHPGEPLPRGFNVSDVFLGALGMLAIVQVIALVLL